MLVPISKLMELGYKHNPNLWIGNGWYFCILCKTYEYHYAVSLDEKSIVVCTKCQHGEVRQ